MSKQENKKPSELIDAIGWVKADKNMYQAEKTFNLAKSYSDMSNLGQMYGRLNMILDTKLWLADEEIKARKQIKESEEKNHEQ